MDVVEATGTRKGSGFSVFVFGDGGAEHRVDATGADTLRAVISRAGLPVSDATRGYIPVDSDDDAPDDDNHDDAHAVAILDRTLDSLGIGRGGRVVCSCCRRIEVEIRYQNQVLRHNFSPRSRVRRVVRWAARRLNIEADDLHLRLCGMTEYLPEGKHLAQLLSGPDCSLCTELVLEPRVQGFQGSATLAPDQQAFTDDLSEVAYLLGESEGRWGRVTDAPMAWPHVLFWVRAASRPNSPERLHLRLVCDGYPALAPTAAFWNPQTNGLLEHARFPRGSGQVQAVFRTDWNGGTALYHPMDRVAAQGHADWVNLYPAMLWNSNRTVVDFLEMVYGLLNSKCYAGCN